MDLWIDLAARARLEPWLRQMPKELSDRVETLVKRQVLSEKAPMRPGNAEIRLVLEGMGFDPGDMGHKSLPLEVLAPCRLANGTRVTICKDKEGRAVLTRGAKELAKEATEVTKKEGRMRC